MKILADKNILHVENDFGQFGELVLFDGRNLQREELLDADALLVRSITRVDEPLLRGSNIKFVGTATSGTDHLDLKYLEDNAIYFAHARGSNANAVVDYCFTALAYAVVNAGLEIENSVIGIVGGGKVGGLFAAKLAAMNISYRICDPPLAVQQAAPAGDSQFQYSSLDEVLQCDVVSLHVPLLSSGEFPTKKMIKLDQLQRLKDNALLIHTCRGGVVDESALREFLKSRPDVTSVVDVWEGEPAIDERTAELVDVATPHIAGYSRESKFAATEYLLRAFQFFFKVGEIEYVDTTAESVELVFEEKGESEMMHWKAMLTAFPIEALSQRFKQALALGKGSEAFDEIRRQLLHRREFKSMRLDIENYNDTQKNIFSVLGFNTTD